MSTTTTQASPYLPVRDDWLARRTETILEPRCRSSIRTIICGNGQAGAICSMICWPIRTAATTSSPPSSCSAAPCIGPADPRNSGRSVKPSSSTASPR